VAAEPSAQAASFTSVSSVRAGVKRRQSAAE
jgi:hypothetical protein